MGKAPERQRGNNFYCIRLWHFVHTKLLFQREKPILQDISYQLTLREVVQPFSIATFGTRKPLAAVHWQQ
jgi:hypothetical protein